MGTELKDTEEDPQYTTGQLMRVAAVYEFLAQLIPTEGRDYLVHILFPEPENPSTVSVKFEPLNSLGKVWCDYCSEFMAAQNSKK